MLRLFLSNMVLNAEAQFRKRAREALKQGRKFGARGKNNQRILEELRAELGLEELRQSLEDQAIKEEPVGDRVNEDDAVNAIDSNFGSLGDPAPSAATGVSAAGAACPAGVTPAACPGAPALEADAVLRVHQIFGFFRKKGAPPPNMSNLFRQSRDAWHALCREQGYEYNLWGPEQVETLMRQHYPGHLERYKRFRHAIMRVDFAKMAILHHYGGLYVDLDVLPNRSEYHACELGLCEVPRWRCRGPDHGGGSVVRGGSVMEMEVLMAKAGHPIFLRWMAYTHTQVLQKGKIKVYHRRRPGRFVLHTTGPYAFTRFIRSEGLYNFTHLKLNRPDCIGHLEKHPEELKNYEFLSYPSCSWMARSSGGHSRRFPSRGCGAGKRPWEGVEGTGRGRQCSREPPPLPTSAVSMSVRQSGNSLNQFPTLDTPAPHARTISRRG